MGDPPRTGAFRKRFEVLPLKNLVCQEPRCDKQPEFLVRFREHRGEYVCSEHVGSTMTRMDLYS